MIELVTFTDCFCHSSVAGLHADGTGAQTPNGRSQVLLENILPAFLSYEMSDPNDMVKTKQIANFQTQWGQRGPPGVVKQPLVQTAGLWWLIHFSLLIVGQWLKWIFGYFIFCNKSVVLFFFFIIWIERETWLPCFPWNFYGVLPLFIGMLLWKLRRWQDWQNIWTTEGATQMFSVWMYSRYEELALPSKARPSQTKVTTLM